jgi:hypothetical protein
VTCGTGWPAAAEAPPMQMIKMSPTASVKPSERRTGVNPVYPEQTRGGVPMVR